ncbi:sensor histidine kinase [Amycolatopsis minnesotensis]|uniref:histidine kinase n=1 Tax=Amycolatopsis minnesotensis TaxID=337894 RepID=A0ABP5D9N1_9PSEU
MSTEGLSIPGISVGRPGAGVADRIRHRNRTTLLDAVRQRMTPLLLIIFAIMIAVLDVWLGMPKNAPGYSIALSAAACLALPLGRWLPFAGVVATVPGFLTGWSQLAAMIALGMLATRKQFHWQTWAGAGLVWMCRFVKWPLTEFADMSWRAHVLDAIYGVLVAGMPVALGLLICARSELSQRLAELATSRVRERRLHADAVRAEERARLAREMHDVVSHDITLIAMQAGILANADAPGASPEARQTAQIIRQLSTRTLEELRSLVGVLRSGVEDDGPQPGVTELSELIRGCDVPVQLSVERIPDALPNKVSAAAYRTVQECLTNVHKHAPGATAIVQVIGDEGALRVEVRNEGARQPATFLPSGGYGLTGMAERARLLGGSFETAATKDGGFEVRARYPIAT